MAGPRSSARKSLHAEGRHGSENSASGEICYELLPLRLLLAGYSSVAALPRRLRCASPWCVRLVVVGIVMRHRISPVPVRARARTGPWPCPSMDPSAGVHGRPVPETTQLRRGIGRTFRWVWTPSTFPFPANRQARVRSRRRKLDLVQARGLLRPNREGSPHRAAAACTLSARRNVVQAEAAVSDESSRPSSSAGGLCVWLGAICTSMSRT